MRSHDLSRLFGGFLPVGFIPVSPQNGVMTGVYPGSPAGFMVVVVSYMSYNKFKQLDPSLGLMARLGHYVPIR